MITAAQAREKTLAKDTGTLQNTLAKIEGFIMETIEEEAVEFETVMPWIPKYEIDTVILYLSLNGYTVIETGPEKYKVSWE